MVISAYTDDSSLVSSLGNYFLYCGYYRLNFDHKVAHHYTESQFRKDDICSDVNLHSSWIVLKKFWEPDGSIELNEVFRDSRRLRSISVGENSMFGANEKTVLWFDIQGKRVSIEIEGKWNSKVKQQLVGLFGKKLTNAIINPLFKCPIIGIPNRYRNRVSNRLDSDPDFDPDSDFDHEKYRLFGWRNNKHLVEKANDYRSKGLRIEVEM